MKKPVQKTPKRIPVDVIVKVKKAAKHIIPGKPAPVAVLEIAVVPKVKPADPRGPNPFPGHTSRGND